MLTEDQAFSLLKRRIFQDRGFDCEQYKENYLKRRIAVRLRATGAEGYMGYLHILKTRPDEYTRLLNELTINVTQFFRDQDVYMKLYESVVPEMLEEKQKVGSRTLRVWSAGCASGEEPYSVAMLIDQRLGDDADKWNIRVVGSDIDERSLEMAKRAVYGEVNLFPGMDVNRYFDVGETDEGPRYRLKNLIRRKVRFEKVDLLDDGKKRHFDMVMCRNVLIYFGRDVQSRIIAHLASSILREGYLILGKSETLGTETGALFKAVFPRERIYQLIREGRKSHVEESAQNG